MAQGMPESSAYQALKRGWYCPSYNQRAYPQLDGPGGFATIETPEHFVRAYVLRTLAQWEIAPRRDLVEDLTQEGLLACWTRRHAPHIQNFPRYYAAMLRGVVYLYLAGKSSSPKIRYNAPFITSLRGLCHGIQLLFLSVDVDRPRVAVPDAPLALAI